MCCVYCKTLCSYRCLVCDHLVVQIVLLFNWILIYRNCIFLPILILLFCIIKWSFFLDSWTSFIIENSGCIAMIGKHVRFGLIYLTILCPYMPYFCPLAHILYSFTHRTVNCLSNLVSHSICMATRFIYHIRWLIHLSCVCMCVCVLGTLLPKENGHNAWLPHNSSPWSSSLFVFLLL